MTTQGDNERPHSPLEREVLEILWSNGRCSAEAVRSVLLGRERELSGSAVRTVLHRLTEKGFVSFRRDGRRNLYQSLMTPQQALAVTVKRILGQLSNAGVGDLVVGMVESDMLSPGELKRLRAQIDQAELRKGKGESDE